MNSIVTRNPCYVNVPDSESCVGSRVAFDCQMPPHVYENANPRLKRLLGFLDHGAYG